MASCYNCGQNECGCDLRDVAEEIAAAESRYRAVEAERDRLAAEVKRLRVRVHEAVDECQRRYGPVESQLAKLRGLMYRARDLHNAEMAKTGHQPNTHISGYGQATAAMLIGELDKARAELSTSEARGYARAVAALRDMRRRVLLEETDYMAIDCAADYLESIIERGES